MSNQPKSVVLHNTTGSANKCYHVQLIETDGGWLVNAQNGPIGKTLTPRTKTPTPVTYEVADKAYTKLVQSKLKEGYEEVGTASQQYAHLDDKNTVTNFPISLLNPIGNAEASVLMRSPEWCSEIKHDGERRLLVADGDDFYGVNRSRRKVAIQERFAAALSAARFTGLTVIDGEDMGDTVVIFDVQMIDGRDLTSLSYQERCVAREGLRERLPALSFVKTAFSAHDKLELDACARRDVHEGVVYKRIAAIHLDGRPNSGGDMLKNKFVERATVRIRALHPTKRSAGMEMLDRAGAWVEVGNVTIPPNHCIPAVGDLAEIEYLYAHLSGSLYQPVYLGQRTDIDASECIKSRLKFVEARVALAA